MKINIQWNDALRERLEPRQLNFPLFWWCLLYSFYQRVYSLFTEGFSRLCGWSMQSENLRAMLERILHMSTSWCVRSLAPSLHLSISQSRFSMLQFQSLGLSWLRNFSRGLTGFLVIFLTCYLSLRYSLMVSAMAGEGLMGGSRSMVDLACCICILLMALLWLEISSSRNFTLFFRSWFSLCRFSFSFLKKTSFSRISETCFLVGERASCSSLRLSCSRFISVCRSVMMISYLRLILASLYLLQRLMPLSSSEIMESALPQRLLRLESSAIWMRAVLRSVMQSITVQRQVSLSLWAAYSLIGFI